MNLSEIEPLARSLLDQLSSACVRIEIKGSIARRKPAPTDIDLVCIPANGYYTISDMFGGETRHEISHMDDALMTLYALGEWELDQMVRRNGPKLKRLRHRMTGVCADLCITDRRHWGIIATIRTGPHDFSKDLVKLAHRRGMFVKDGLLHGHPPSFDGNGDALPCPIGEECTQIVETPEEADVFRALGLDWIEPWRRTADALRIVRPA